MLFDIYHHQILEGNVIQDTNNISKIAHIREADVLGRHEPGTGEINYAKRVSRDREFGVSRICWAGVQAVAEC